MSEEDEKKKPEAVDHPAHYNQSPSGIECIDVIEHLPFNVGTAMKYLWRAGLKDRDPTEDLRKADWYAKRQIEFLKKYGSPAGDVGGAIAQAARLLQAERAAFEARFAERAEALRELESTCTALRAEIDRLRPFSLCDGCGKTEKRKHQDVCQACEDSLVSETKPIACVATAERGATEEWRRTLSAIGPTTCGRCLCKNKWCPWRDDEGGLGYICALCLRDVTRERTERMTARGYAAILMAEGDPRAAHRVITTQPSLASALPLPLPLGYTGPVRPGLLPDQRYPRDAIGRVVEVGDEVLHVGATRVSGVPIVAIEYRGDMGWWADYGRGGSVRLDAYLTRPPPGATEATETA